MQFGHAIRLGDNSSEKALMLNEMSTAVYKLLVAIDRQMEQLQKTALINHESPKIKPAVVKIRKNQSSAVKLALPPIETLLNNNL